MPLRIIPASRLTILMYYPFFIARRLSLSPEGHKSSPAVKVATAAVALSVAVMIAAIAVVTGFKRQITDKVAGFNSHISLYVQPLSEEENNVLTLTPILDRLLEEAPYVTDHKLQLMIPAILKTETDFKGIYLKSSDPLISNGFLPGAITEGEIPDYSLEENRQKIVISSCAASQLGLKTGDRVDCFFITDDLRTRPMTVAGIYNSHFDRYDDVLAFGSLDLLQQISNLSASEGTSMQITTDDFSRVQEYSSDLASRLTHALAEGEVYKMYKVDNALNQGIGFFRWLSLLDTNVVVILTLMTIVACITLISGMMIIILDKKRFIGIMKALGTPAKGLRDIFIFLAMRVALTGMIIGNTLSLALLFIQSHTHFLRLDPESYYIDFVPVDISWEAVVILNLAVLLIVYLVLILPSRFIGKIAPSRTL